MVTVGSIQRSDAQSMKEVLAKRMQELGYTQYRVTQEICKLRAQDGEIPPVTRYNSTVGNALENPQTSQLKMIEDLIEALDGEIVILWHSPSAQQ